MTIDITNDTVDDLHLKSSIYLKNCNNLIYTTED